MIQRSQVLARLQVPAQQWLVTPKHVVPATAPNRNPVLFAGPLERLDLIRIRGFVHIIEDAGFPNHREAGVDRWHRILVGMLDSVGLYPDRQFPNHTCPPQRTELPIYLSQRQRSQIL